MNGIMGICVIPQIAPCDPSNFVPKPFTAPEQDALPARNAEFKAFCDSPCPLDEMRRGLGWTSLPGGFLEQSKPTVEMGGVHRKRQMLGHRTAVITP